MIQDPELRRNFEILSEEIKKLETDADEMRTIRATLAVNCRPNSAFGHYGFKLDDGKSTHDNLLDLLRFLNGKLQDLENPAGDSHLAHQVTHQWLRSIGFIRYMQPATDNGLAIGPWSDGDYPIRTEVDGDGIRHWWVFKQELPVGYLPTRNLVRSLVAALVPTP